VALTALSIVAAWFVIGGLRFPEPRPVAAKPAPAPKEEAPKNPVVQPAPDEEPKEETPRERENRLRKAADESLAAARADPAGVDLCIELGVLYLEQDKVREAKSLFDAMNKRRSSPPYHFVGLLGLAVTDSLQGKHLESRWKFAFLFEPK